MKDIREFLSQLSKELRRSEDFDIEARQILEELHKDADKVEPTLDRIKELEAKFASKHPALEQIVRELADTMAKMGI